jgi:glycosyltransferase involved in cell wall biosynthesis
MKTEPSVPDVSVVIATYNMGQYLGAALSSVLRQSAGELEIHVVDDGSTDNTSEVVAPFLVDQRVYYHRQDNAGQTKAKNVGVRAARGRYVGFCDADDLWDVNKLAVQLPILDADPSIAVAYTRVRPMDKDGTLLPVTIFTEPSGTVTKSLFIENFVPFGTALVRRSALEAVGGFDENLRMGIDWDLWLRLSVSYRFQAIPQETYFYRVWDGQMSKNWKGRFDSAFRIMSQFEANYPTLIDPLTRKTAYSLSYRNRAYARAQISGDVLGCIQDCIRSVRAGGALWPALKVALRSATPSVA